MRDVSDFEMNVIFFPEQMATPKFFKIILFVCIWVLVLFKAQITLEMVPMERHCGFHLSVMFSGPA